MADEGGDVDRIFARADRLCEALRQVSSQLVLVSNEVGSGIVPESSAGRLYRDLLGGVNQRVAAVADRVLLLVAGCPLTVKNTTAGGS
jgi:adenosylcobinamide kinase/adenosylcobinamide-phosphate guanylyltransferase